MNHKRKENAQVKELQRYIKTLEEAVLKLSQDPSYGILNRAAVDLELPLVEHEVKYLCFLDVDYLHEFNSRFGHEEANKRIRRALHIRAGDVLLSARWYSGDEIIILTAGDPMAFCERLKQAFINEGMSITIAFAPYTGKIIKDAAKAKEIVDRSKAARGSQR